MVSTANRIPRYVEPQTIYNANNAIQIFVFIHFLLLFIRWSSSPVSLEHIDTGSIQSCPLLTDGLATRPTMCSQTLSPAKPSSATRHSDNFQTHRLCGSHDDMGSILRSGYVRLAVPTARMAPACRYCMASAFIGSHCASGTCSNASQTFNWKFVPRRCKFSGLPRPP